MRLFLNMNAHSEPPVDLLTGFEGAPQREANLMHVSGARRTSG
jgi:hypothetical protein